MRFPPGDSRRGPCIIRLHELILDYAGLSADNQRVVTYVVQIVIVGVMAAGVSWSHIRRRVSGQYDADDVDN